MRGRFVPNKRARVTAGRDNGHPLRLTYLSRLSVHLGQIRIREAFRGDGSDASGDQCEGNHEGLQHCRTPSWGRELEICLGRKNAELRLLRLAVEIGLVGVREAFRRDGGDAGRNQSQGDQDRLEHCRVPSLRFAFRYAQSYRVWDRSFN